MEDIDQVSVTEIARYTIKTGTGDEFAERLASAVRELTSSSETLEVLLYRGVENSEDFRLVVTWTSIDAHLAWRNTEERSRFRGAIDELLAAPIEVAHFNGTRHKAG
jgi:heme-degrading monooxygenase HmoA